MYSLHKLMWYIKSGLLNHFQVERGREIEREGGRGGGREGGGREGGREGGGREGGGREGGGREGGTERER